jgi:hypothetical protein
MLSRPLKLASVKDTVKSPPAGPRRRKAKFNVRNAF